MMWTVSREVQCTNIKQNNNESYSWIVQLLKLNCLGVSCGFMGFCSDYSSGRCLVDDGGCGIDRMHVEQKLHTTSYMAEGEVVGEQKLDGILMELTDKQFIWMVTGEVYNRGFFIIKAVDLYWRGE